MKIRIQLNVNIRIHYENIFIIFSIIKYLFNIPLFHSTHTKKKKPFLSQIFPEIYNLEWPPDTQIWQNFLLGGDQCFGYITN
jgi:hypothetical protein